MPETASEALEAVVDFMASVELSKFALLEAMSGGFQLPLLDPGVDLDGSSLALIDSGRESVASHADATLAAFDVLAREAAAGTGDPSKPGLAMPASAPLDALRQAATSFFNWIGGSGTRARQRVVSITSTMTDGQRKQLFDEWRQFYPEAPAAGGDHVAFFSELQSGKLDGVANQIHSQFMDVSASSVDTYRYSEIAQDKNLLVEQIVVEEGREGLERGAELELEASTEALGGLFPGLRQGRKLAEKAIKVSEYAEKLYKDAVTGLTEVDDDQLREAAKERLGDALDAEASDEFASALSEMSTDVLGAAAGLAGDADLIAKLDDFGRVVVSEPDASVAIATNIGGRSAAGPQITVAVGEPDALAVEGAPGKFSIQTFAADGKQLSVLSGEIEAGWETLAGRSTVSVEREQQRAVLARTPVPRVSPTPTPRPDFDWVLAEVITNRNKIPVRVDHPGEYYVGQYVEWTVADQELTQHVHSVFRGAYQFDWTFQFAFDRPPERLKPGQEYTLEVNATGDSTVVGYAGGYPAAEFQFVPRNGPTVKVTWDNPSASFTQTFKAPTFMGQQYEAGAILWNCAACNVTYVYRPVVDVVPTEVVPPAPGEIFLQEIRSCDDRFQSFFFRTLCESAREARDLLEAAEGRAGNSNPCTSPKTDEQRLACQIAQLARTGDPAQCEALPQEVQLLCLAPIAEKRHDPSLLVPYGDGALAAYAGTGDLAVLDLIKDPEYHDAAVMLALSNMVGALFAGDDDARLPAPNYCDRMRGSWGYDEQFYDDGPILRSTCEEFVGTVRAIQLDSEGECEIAAKRAEQALVFVDEPGKPLADCLSALADYRSIPVTRP